MGFSVWVLHFSWYKLIYISFVSKVFVKAILDA